MHNLYIIAVFLEIFIIPIAIAQKTREVSTINERWLYKNIQERSFDTINLPHTWNAFDAVDPIPGYRRDTGIYIKYIPFKKITPNERYFLHFEGANISTFVYVNNKFAGKHIGGYIGFKIEITPYIIKNKINKIEIRVDNSNNPEIIPSQKSDFTIHGGINRDVFLCKYPENYIQQIQIKTPTVTKDIAKTQVTVIADIKNKKTIPNQLSLKIINPTGQIVKDTVINEPDLKSNQIEYTFSTLYNPLLWSTENPQLYSMVVNFITNGKITDTDTTNFGYRWFEFKEYGAFYLNGERLLIRGTHRHEDHAGLGNALSNEQQIKDMQLIKEMGGNFVRLAHYPQDPIIYKYCDENGILVWDELPWCRGGVGNNAWRANSKRLLEEQINQNYNHPSIIIWSMGNEIDWLADFKGGENIDSINRFLKELHDISKKMDPYRYTGMRKSKGAENIVDVYSPSIWSGWYAGVYKDYNRAITESQKKFPRFIHMEYGGDSHVGRHVNNPITGDGAIPSNTWDESEVQIAVKSISNEGDYGESYMVDLFDWYLSVSEKAPNFTGNAQWSLKDFATPVRPENPIPYMNQKGLCDRAGKPKDAFYVFKSYWNKIDGFVYIESHTWPNRSGKANTAHEIAVYSNCDSVKLLMNGFDMGYKKREYAKFPAHGLTWTTFPIKGSNTVIALGTLNGKEHYDTIRFNYSFNEAKNPYYLKLTAIKINTTDYLITASAFDYDGELCTNYNGHVLFSMLSGKGELSANMGTPTGSLINQFASGVASIVYHSNINDKAVIGVMGYGMKGEFITIEE